MANNSLATRKTQLQIWSWCNSLNLLWGIFLVDNFPLFSCVLISDGIVPSLFTYKSASKIEVFTGSKNWVFEIFYLINFNRRISTSVQPISDNNFFNSLGP